MTIRVQPLDLNTYTPNDMISQGELEVAALAALGWGNKRIGGRLFLSDEAVKSRLRSLYRKLGAGGGANARTGAVVELIRLRLLVWDRERRGLVPNKEMSYNREGLGWPREAAAQ